MGRDDRPDRRAAGPRISRSGVRRLHAVSFRAAFAQSLSYFAVAVAFGVVFGTIAGWEYGAQYFAGWVVETSLSRSPMRTTVAACHARGPRRVATPLFLVLLTIGTTDILFALDSIPAVFGVTEEPFIVLTANAFAPLGLRARYFLVTGLLDRLVYLSTGLAVILAFIGVKLVLHFDHLQDDAVPEIATTTSLAVIVVVLTITTIASVLKARRDPTARPRRNAPAPARGRARAALIGESRRRSDRAVESSSRTHAANTPCGASEATGKRQLELTAVVADDAEVGSGQGLVGTRFVGADDLPSHGRSVGRGVRSCEVVAAEQARTDNRAQFQCLITLRLPAGVLTLQAIPTLTEQDLEAVKAAVTGGTGAFRRARGEALVQEVSEAKTRYVIDLR